MNTPDLYKNPLEILTTDGDQLKDIVFILETAPHKRKPDDLERLYETLKDVDFFRDLLSTVSKEACLLLLKQVKHEIVGRAKPVFNYGDAATRFFLILKGSVCIIAPKHKGQQGARGSQFYENRQTHRSSKLVRKSAMELEPVRVRKGSAKIIEEDQLATPEEITRLYPDHIVLNTLKSGQHFGEIALNLNTTRTATAVCLEGSHFLTMSPSVYNKVLSDYHEKKQRDFVEFFQMAPVTKDWPFESLIGLIYQSRVEEYKRNQIIYDIGEPCNFVYFIKQGEVEIVKETHLNIPDDELCNKTVQTRHPVSMEKTKLMHLNSLWKRQHTQAKAQQIRMALLGKYQSFGNEEFTEATEVRQSRAIVKSTTAEIVIVSYKKFVENKNNPRDLCLKLLSIERSPKKQWRELFQNNLIKSRLANDDGLEKTRSKFGHELNDCINLFHHKQDDYTEMGLIPERDATRKLNIPITKLALKFTKSASPSFRRREASTDGIVEMPVPKSPIIPLTRTKKQEFVQAIHPDAKSVTVVFKSKKAVVIDPSLVPICLNLASHSFQNSKMYQSYQVPQQQIGSDSIMKETEVITSSNKNSGPILPRAFSLERTTERSPIGPNKSLLSPVARENKFTTPENSFDGKSPLNGINKKLGELVKARNGRVMKSPSNKQFLSLSISSVFVNNSVNPGLLDESGIKNTKREEKDIERRKRRAKNQSTAMEPCYVSGAYLPRTLSQKRNFSVKKLENIKSTIEEVW